MIKFSIFLKYCTRILLFLIVLVSLFSCKHKFGIERGIRPLSGSDVEIRKDGPVVVRCKNFDMTIEHIDVFKWVKLLQQDLFVKNEQVQSEIRIPKFIFFQIIIQNVSSFPIALKSITIIYGDNEKKPLSHNEAAKRCKSPAFSLFNFKSILTPKRLLDKEISIKKINYAKDTIGFNLDFISPGDRILKIVAFDWVPVQYRKFSIKTKVAFTKSGVDEKIVDFNFSRFEYRTKGKYFRRIKEKSKELEP